VIFRIFGFEINVFGIIDFGFFGFRGYGIRVFGFQYFGRVLKVSIGMFGMPADQHKGKHFLIWSMAGYSKN